MKVRANILKEMMVDTVYCTCLKIMKSQGELFCLHLYVKPVISPYVILSIL